VGERCAGAPRPLTAREREVLGRMADGASTREIAGALEIAPSTVRTYAQNVLDKLAVGSRVEAAAHIRRPEGSWGGAATTDGAPGRRTDSALDLLTPREAEVLWCVAQGLSGATVAERLFLSPHTVRTHLRNVRAKLGVHSTLAAVAVARRAAGS
jgi:DNA-binding CsgD family transcriptional regulator